MKKGIIQIGRKIMAGFLAIIFLVNISTVNVKAASAEILKSVSNRNALLSVNAKNFDAEIRGHITELGIKINANTLLEVVPVEEEVGITEYEVSDKTDYVICVTNVDGNLVTKNYILMYEEAEEGYELVDLLKDTPITRGVVPFAWPSSHPVTITGSVEYKILEDGPLGTPYFSPQSCQLKITNVENGKKCTKLTGRYFTSGTLFTSNYEWKQSDYEYEISLVQNNPITNQTYKSYKPLPASTGIIQYGGGPFGGARFEVGYTVVDSNGKEKSGGEGFPV